MWLCPRPLQALIAWNAILPPVLIISMLAVPMPVGLTDPLRASLVITVVVPLAVFSAIGTRHDAAGGTATSDEAQK